MRKWQHKGLTLIEVMTVIVIAGIITTTSLITFSKVGHNHRLRTSTLDISQTVNYVRQYALEKNKTYGIDFKGDSLTVFFISGIDTIVESSNTLPPNIKVGYNGDVTTGVGGTALPESGTTFPNNIFIAYTHKGVSSGILYFCSPVESRAFKVNSLGYPILYQWGGGTWHEM